MHPLVERVRAMKWWARKNERQLQALNGANPGTDRWLASFVGKALSSSASIAIDKHKRVPDNPEDTVQAIDEAVRKEGYEIAQIVAAYRKAMLKRDEVPDYLNGIWFFVTFRATRDESQEDPPIVPPDEYRVGLLVFGAVEVTGQVDFELVTQNTNWAGTAQFFENDHLFYLGRQTSDAADASAVKGSREHFCLFTHGYKNKLSPDGRQYGICSGIAPGVDPRRRFPAYGAFACLQKVPDGYFDPALTQRIDGLSEDDQRELRRYSGYFPVSEIEEGSTSEFASPIEAIRHEALRALWRHISGAGSDDRVVNGPNKLLMYPEPPVTKRSKR
jgi:hypothetical protein